MSLIFHNLHVVFHVQIHIGLEIPAVLKKNRTSTLLLTFL